MVNVSKSEWEKKLKQISDLQKIDQDEIVRLKGVIEKYKRFDVRVARAEHKKYLENLKELIRNKEIDIYEMDFLINFYKEQAERL